MARLFLVAILLAAALAFVVILYALWTTIVNTGQRHGAGLYEGLTMAPTGIQKAAYIALITVLFGVASGWLGGL